MFPDRLRELRKGRNITMENLAEEMNKKLEEGQKPNTAAQIGNWERGDRTPSYVEVCKLADYFSVSIDFLVGRTMSEKTDLSLLFLSGKEIDFNGKPLNDQQRFDIFQFVNSYLNPMTGMSDEVRITHQENLF